MKPIEEAFSSSGFRRVILPGILITAGVHPILFHHTHSWLKQYGLSEPAIVLAAEVLVFGLIISSGTNWIYYVYEGFSLPWLTAVARKWNHRRLAAALAAYEKLRAGRTYAALPPHQKAQAALLNETLSDYPLTPTDKGPSRRYVESSTLLGNIITSYELYGHTRYHVDGVFYWFHLLALAPPAVTAEFNDKYAFAESLVVTSFAGALVACLNALVFAAFAFGQLWPATVISTLDVTAAHVATLIALGALVFVLFYLLSLPAHREAGKIFRTIVDLSVPGLAKWAETAPSPVETGVELRLAMRKRYLNSLKK